MQQYAAQRRALFYPKADSSPSPGPPATLSYPAVLTALPGLCRAYFGVRVRSVAALSEQGTWHQLFRATLTDGREVIARFNLSQETLSDYGLLLDKWANAQLQAAGLPALDIYAVDLTRSRCPWDYALMAPAQGTCLREHDNDDETLLPLLRLLGAFLAQVHRLPVAGFGLIVPDADGLSAQGALSSWPAYLLNRLDSHLAICRNINTVSSEESTRIRRLFESAAEHLEGKIPARLLHGDPGNHNVFACNGALACLIDWEDAVAGDPAYEVAFWATFHPPRRHTAFFEGYFAGQPPPTDFMERFWLYFLRVALAKTVVRHNLGLQDRPGRPPASQRIQLALDQLGRRAA
jgi:aminoglycoside phosphotransferase (APT) family kinase protein